MRRSLLIERPSAAFAPFKLIMSENGRNIFSVNAFWFTNVDEALFINYKSSIQVPHVPSKEWQTLFIWPGIQPHGGENYLPIDNGVLQPVLTWGQSCAPNPSNATIDYENTWWISAQYINTIGSFPGFMGCYGGNQMAVSPQDHLDMIMEKDSNSNVWTQRVINRINNQSVEFEFDFLKQKQG